MLTREQKQTMVTELRDRVQRATGVFVADYRGLSVQQINDLRLRLRKAGEGYEYRVAKNRLMLRAIEGSTAEGLAPHLTGPTAIAFSFGESVGLAKVLVQYAKEHEKFALKGGVFDGRPVSSGEIAQIATLPSLQELRAKLVYLVNSPAQRIASVLQAPAAQLARVVDARRAQLEEPAGS